jgi:hypothetical protein
VSPVLNLAAAMVGNKGEPNVDRAVIWAEAFVQPWAAAQRLCSFRPAMLPKLRPKSEFLNGLDVIPV